MSIFKKIFISIIFSTITVICMGQDYGVSIGNWRTHLPYQKVIDVAISHSRVYAATPYELFYYDTDDQSINIINKVNGLNDFGIKVMRYCQAADMVVVAYNNANLDFIDRAGNITNLSDIKNANLPGNKTINDIYFDGSTAYFACGFGIVVIDLLRQEVRDTYYIGNLGRYINVNDITIFNEKIYAATDEGLYSALKNIPNLADYSQWTRDTSIPTNSTNIADLENFGNNLIINFSHIDASRPDTLMVYNGSEWNYFMNDKQDNYRCLRAIDTNFYLCGLYEIYVLSEQLNLIEELTWPGGAVNPLAVAVGNNGWRWIGDLYRGLIKSEHTDWGNNIKPYGPNTNNAYQIISFGNDVWVAAGGRASNWAPLWIEDGIFHFNGSDWITHSGRNTTELNNVIDFVCTAVNPLKPTQVFSGTWGSGIVEFNDDKVSAIYNADNSTLRPQINIEAIKISGLAFDSKNNLWAANSGVNNILSAYNLKTKTWQSYNLGLSNSNIDISSMMIDHNDTKWIIKRIDGMLLAYNEEYSNTAITLTSTAGNGNISGTSVYCMATDLNGAVWLGTDNGVSVFNTPKNIFLSNKSHDATQILVPRNDGSGQADPLFSGQKVLSIAVDGANNKWFGTESGVYQMSSDGLTQLNFFSTENSPLLNNRVNTIGINSDGEIFFGTNSGIISYRGKASQSNEDNSQISVYPNPCRPDYDGYIGIKGLVDNATVKITTISGALVTQIQSEGGQAVWDRKSLDGRDVSSGIYLIFVSNNRGSETCVSKLLLMQ